MNIPEWAFDQILEKHVEREQQAEDWLSELLVGDGDDFCFDLYENCGPEIMRLAVAAANYRCLLPANYDTDLRVLDEITVRSYVNSTLAKKAQKLFEEAIENWSPDDQSKEYDPLNNEEFS